MSANDAEHHASGTASRRRFGWNTPPEPRCSLALELMRVSRECETKTAFLEGLGIAFDNKSGPGTTVSFCASKKMSEDGAMLQDIETGLSEGVALRVFLGEKDNQPLMHVATRGWRLTFLINGGLRLVSAKRADHWQTSEHTLEAPWKLVPHFNLPLAPYWLLMTASMDKSSSQSVNRGPEWRVPSDDWHDENDPRLGQLPGVRQAMTSLADALELVKWRADQLANKQRHWEIEISDADESEENFALYTVAPAKLDGCRKTGQALEIVGLKRRNRAHAWWDESTESWRLRASIGLQGTITFREAVDDPLWRQRFLVDRLSRINRLTAGDVAALATQLQLPPSFREKPIECVVKLAGEDSWEARQMDALRLGLSGWPLVAIKGPPGTGKSTVIVGLIRRLVAAGQRVLLVAPTHVALDEVLRRIDALRSNDFESAILPVRIRPLNEAKVDPGMLKYTVDQWANTVRKQAQKSLRNALRDMSEKHGRVTELVERQSWLKKKERLHRALSTHASLIEKGRTLEEMRSNCARDLITLERERTDTGAKAKNLKEKADALSPSFVFLPSFFSPKYAKAANAARDAQGEVEALARRIQKVRKRLSELESESHDTEEQTRTANADLSSALADLDLPDRQAGESAVADLVRFRKETEELALAVGNAAEKLKWISSWRDLLSQDSDDDDPLVSWVIKSANLVTSTTQGIASSRHFRDTTFDVLICDESSRVTRGEVLVPASRAKRVILVGDEYQLPPYVEKTDEMIVQSCAVLDEARDVGDCNGVAETLAEHWNLDEPEFRPFRAREIADLAVDIKTDPETPPTPKSVAHAHDAVARASAYRHIANALTGSCFDHVLGFIPKSRWVRLDVQRRMPSAIANLVKDSVYNGDYKSPSSGKDALITPVFQHAWMFIDTSKHQSGNPRYRETLEGTGFVNHGEVDQVVETIQHFCQRSQSAGLPPPSIMVITFYLGQARLIGKAVRKLSRKLLPMEPHVLPIDRCQGQEADLVIISFSRTVRNPRSGTGLWIQDPRRLNVAVTRAKRALVLVGCARTLMALRGSTDGERILAHIGNELKTDPSHRIFSISEGGDQ